MCANGQTPATSLSSAWLPPLAECAVHMMPAWFLQIYSELNVWHAGPVLLAGQVKYLDVPTVCVCGGGGEERPESRSRVEPGEPFLPRQMPWLHRGHTTAITLNQCYQGVSRGFQHPLAGDRYSCLQQLCLLQKISTSKSP